MWGSFLDFFLTLSGLVLAVFLPGSSFYWLAIDYSSWLLLIEVSSSSLPTTNITIVFQITLRLEFIHTLFQINLVLQGRALEFCVFMNGLPAGKHRLDMPMVTGWESKPLIYSVCLSWCESTVNASVFLSWCTWGKAPTYESGGIRREPPASQQHLTII